MDGVDFDWTDAGSPEDHADKLEVISEYAGDRGRYRQAIELHTAAQCIRGLAEENDCLVAENEALWNDNRRLLKLVESEPDLTAHGKEVTSDGK